MFNCHNLRVQFLFLNCINTAQFYQVLSRDVIAGLFILDLVVTFHLD
jgi:hypothetical protein